ncbi:hypothetical protein Zmor_017441 [Zophobas morio]|uniref:Uncharacterized protein n=1 Tax=Zophobas morio TaxID=2755281 RepID=A0AA38MC61_9CUCU|nr:hypothetical protein Zmor_017441 [Zophobas morio]
MKLPDPLSNRSHHLGATQRHFLDNDPYFHRLSQTVPRPHQSKTSLAKPNPPSPRPAKSRQRANHGKKRAKKRSSTPRVHLSQITLFPPRTDFSLRARR